jgi:Domain of unknown function (DUF1905)
VTAKHARFEAELLRGHKGAAVEVPFDPAAQWSLDPVPLWRGRRGFPVEAMLDGVSFASAIVPRMRRHFLLVDDQVRTRAKARIGAIVKVTVRPAKQPKEKETE